MRQFHARQFNPQTAAAGGPVTIPDPADVRLGVEYGADDALTGTAVVCADITVDGGFSQFDVNQQQVLDSQYANQGRPAVYNGNNLLIMIVDQQTMINQDDQTKEVETITVMIRRYNSPVVKPALGDALDLIGDESVEKKTFRLTDLPAGVFTHLEWELIFSRTKTVRRGGVAVSPYGRG